MKLYDRVFVLELMGSGSAFRGLGVDGICAVSMGESGNNDLLSKRTWKSNSEWLKHNASGQRFNFIVCRPVGGVHTIPDADKLFGFFLQECWHCLSNNGGVLLSQLPGSLGDPRSSDKINAWIEKANSSIPGFYARYQGCGIIGSPSNIAAIRIDRYHGSPRDFPQLSISG